MGKTIPKVVFAFLHTVPPPPPRTHAFLVSQRALNIWPYVYIVIRAHAALEYLELAMQAGYKEAAELLMKAHGKLAFFYKAEYKSDSFG